LPYNGVDGLDEHLLRLGARCAEMGDELDGLGTGPLSDRKPIGAPICASPFPPPETGAGDQSFRLIVRPDLWEGPARPNALGTWPVTFDGVHVGLQQSAAALVPGSNQPVWESHAKRLSPEAIWPR
jgi:hypothetical protein